LDTTTKILSATTNGASHASIVALNPHVKHDEIEWLLKMLVGRNLLELDSSMTYWTTVDGVKFLEIQFHMECILRAQKSLV
jgi:hypothetical protein